MYRQAINKLGNLEHEINRIRKENNRLSNLVSSQQKNNATNKGEKDRQINSLQQELSKTKQELKKLKSIHYRQKH
jgi:chromosome segregation ATPase